jgi:hypothetical protein
VSMRRVLIAGVMAAALVVTVTVGLLFGPGASSPEAIVLQPTDTASSAPATEQRATTSPSPDSTAAPETPGENDPGETDRSEAVPVPQPEAAPPALMTLPLPDSATVVGSIVSGFPVEIIPVAPDSVIDSSSVAVEGPRLQAALSGQSNLGAGEVVEFYLTALAELGLVAVVAPAPDGSSALAFTRGGDNVSLTVTTVESGCRYVVFGTFAAES